MDARSIRPRGRPAAPLRSLPALLLLAIVAACSGSAATPSANPTAAPGAATPSPVAPSPAPSESPVAEQFPLTLTDDEGATVNIPAAPARIVSLTPAATETLFALDVGNRVVGKVEDFTVYPPEAAKAPDVAKFGSVDVEKIVDLGTDLVIAGGNKFNPPDSIQKLRSLGVPTLVVYAPDLKTSLADIDLIGRAVGRSAAATTLSSSIQEAFDDVSAAVASVTRPRVYYELDATNGYYGPAPDYFGTEMIRIAGGEPLTSGTSGVFQIDPETIISFDPQVILLGDAAYGVTSDQVKDRPGWGVLSAVKTGDVRPIDDVIVTRPGPRLADGIRALAIAIHPDLALPSTAP